MFFATVKIPIRITYDGLELQEEPDALHGRDREACRALGAVLKAFFAVW